jgi:hypothetical protein
MADYDVGYGKPPKHTHFKPGQSGNRNGRPKSEIDPVADVAKGVMNARAQWHENGQTKTGTIQEVSIKLLAEKAANGDTGAAELLLKKRKHALRRSQNHVVLVTDVLPECPDRTVEQNVPDPAGSAADVAQGPDKGDQVDDEQTRAADHNSEQDNKG